MFYYNFHIAVFIYVTRKNYLTRVSVISEFSECRISICISFFMSWWGSYWFCCLSYSSHSPLETCFCSLLSSPPLPSLSIYGLQQFCSLPLRVHFCIQWLLFSVSQVSIRVISSLLRKKSRNLIRIPYFLSSYSLNFYMTFVFYLFFSLLYIFLHQGFL